MNDPTNVDYIGDQEAANEAACFECALANGHTADEAENCDNGSVGCRDCPFRAKEEA